MDVAINAASDMLFQGGDIVFVRDQAAIAQHIKMRIATWLGESPYDTNNGTPYIEVIFAPGTSLTSVRFILERRVLDTPGVTGCVITPVLDRETRVLTATGRATTIEGDVDFTLSISP